MVKNTTTVPLDERIAAVLAAPDQPSSVFADLIAEVDGAVDDADRTASEARARSVDPAIVDADAHSRAKDAEYLAQRLHNALSALQELHCEAMAREQVTAWHADADAVAANRDKLAAEMAEKYPAATAWIVDFLQRMSACDREVFGLMALRLPSNIVGSSVSNSRPAVSTTLGSTIDRSLRHCACRPLCAVTVRPWLGRRRRFRFPCNTLRRSAGELPRLVVGQHGSAAARRFGRPRSCP